MVDCDKHPDDALCEKPVSTMQKTVIPICILAGVLLIAAIIFVIFVRRRNRLEREWEDKARQKHRDLFKDDDGESGQSNGKLHDQSPENPESYTSNPQELLRNQGSAHQLMRLHPSMDTQQKPAEQRSFV